MKKFLVILAVLALTMVSSIAMAEVTVDGSIDVMMRSIKNTQDWNDQTKGSGDFNQTYQRTRLGINAKNDGVKARIQIENDYDVWGRVEQDQANATVTTTVTAATATSTTTAGRLQIRESWIDFNIPGAGTAHIKVGHQFLQLGNGWFFRSGKYGSDAWLVGLPGKNTVAFVNVKASEGSSFQADDTDAYVLLDNFKIDDKNTVGAYFARVNARSGGATVNTATVLDTIGLHYNGVVGPVKLQAELNFQSGETQADGSATKTDLSGNQIVLQASLPMDALTINAVAAMGSGDDAGSASEVEQMGVLLDKDIHYTLVYEYFMKTAACATNTGFANTTALALGADFKINKMVTVGANLWMLQGTEKFSANGGVADKDAGMEIDAKLLLQIADTLSWNTGFGYFAPGKAYENAAGKADAATAIQSVIAVKF